MARWKPALHAAARGSSLLVCSSSRGTFPPNFLRTPRSRPWQTRPHSEHRPGFGGTTFFVPMMDTTQRAHQHCPLWIQQQPHLQVGKLRLREAGQLPRTAGPANVGPETDYFHLFICVAIVAIYGDDVIEQQLATDQMLLHFANLAMHMNGELVLRKARSLLYQFRLLPRIPCSLHDLCKLCGTGMWDSGCMPSVECAGHHPGSESCPYGGTVEMPSPRTAREGKKAPKTPREGFGFRR